MDLSCTCTLGIGGSLLGEKESKFQTKIRVSKVSIQGMVKSGGKTSKALYYMALKRVGKSEVEQRAKAEKRMICIEEEEEPSGRMGRYLKYRWMSWPESLLMVVPLVFNSIQFCVSRQRLIVQLVLM